MNTPRLPAGNASLSRRSGGSTVVFFCLTLGFLHAQETEDCLKHFYGSKSRPQIEIEIQQSEGNPPCLILNVFEPNGVASRASSQFPKPDDSRKKKTELELAGTTRLHGRELRYLATLSDDRSSLEWLKPKSVLLADGTKLELAGRYDHLSEKSRAASAKAAFDAVDKVLNAVYSLLSATLDPAAQEKLRAEQQRWLKYRDFTIYDGDDFGIIGPGTAPHFRQQGRRTLERIEFLKALRAKSSQAEAGNILYSDGRGGTIAVGRMRDAIFFSAMVSYPNLNSADAPGDVPCGLGGLARPVGGNVWLAKPKDMVETDGSWKVEPLRLVFDTTGGLKIEAEGENASPGPLARVVGGSYHRLRVSAPAEEPLRSLLWQLPETAFQETTEGLTADEKKALALTGTGGTFKIEKETRNFLQLRHHDGTVKLLRLTDYDGAAVIAVEQTNVRNLFLHVWRKPRAGDPFALWENALLKAPIKKLFTELTDAETAKIKGKSRR